MPPYKTWLSMSKCQQNLYSLETESRGTKFRTVNMLRYMRFPHNSLGTDRKSTHICNPSRPQSDVSLMRIRAVCTLNDAVATTQSFASTSEDSTADVSNAFMVRKNTCSSSSASARTAYDPPGRRWGMMNAPVDNEGLLFGWRTKYSKSLKHSAAGVVPFSYFESKGELYVLLSLQRSQTGELVYTFLGGKVAAADKDDARRTAAREAHEETHRLLSEDAVYKALLGCGVESVASSRDQALQLAAVPEPPTTTTAAAAAATSEEDTSVPKRRGGEQCGEGSVPCAPHEYFPSGCYTAFGLYLPNAWHLPESFKAKIKAKDTHPQAAKAEGLEWVSLRRLQQLRAAIKSKGSAGKGGGGSGSGGGGGGAGSSSHYREFRAHFFMLALLRTKREGVGVYTWLERLQSHIRDWHGWRGGPVGEEGPSQRASDKEAGAASSKRGAVAEGSGGCPPGPVHVDARTRSLENSGGCGASGKRNAAAPGASGSAAGGGAAAAPGGISGPTSRTLGCDAEGRLQPADSHVAPVTQLAARGTSECSSRRQPPPSSPSSSSLPATSSTSLRWPAAPTSHQRGPPPSGVSQGGDPAQECDPVGPDLMPRLATSGTVLEGLGISGVSGGGNAECSPTPPPGVSSLHGDRVQQQKEDEVRKSQPQRRTFKLWRLDGLADVRHGKPRPQPTFLEPVTAPAGPPTAATSARSGSRNLTSSTSELAATAPAAPAVASATARGEGSATMSPSPSHVTASGPPSGVSLAGSSASPDDTLKRPSRPLTIWRINGSAESHLSPRPPPTTLMSSDARTHTGEQPSPSIAATTTTAATTTASHGTSARSASPSPSSSLRDGDDTAAASPAPPLEGASRQPPPSDTMLGRPATSNPAAAPSTSAAALAAGVAAHKDCTAAAGVTAHQHRPPPVTNHAIQAPSPPPPPPQRPQLSSSPPPDVRSLSYEVTGSNPLQSRETELPLPTGHPHQRVTRSQPSHPEPQPRWPTESEIQAPSHPSGPVLERRNDGGSDSGGGGTAVRRWTPPHADRRLFTSLTAHNEDDKAATVSGRGG